jgi:chemotaxis protein CheC
MDPRLLDASQLDAMREVANIGAGHAATALSRITKRVVMIDVPDVEVVPVQSVDRLVGDPGEVVAGVRMMVVGDVRGCALQVFPAASAQPVASALMGSAAPPFPDGFDQTHLAALLDAGSLILGEYLGALSECVGMLLIPTAPDIVVEQAGAMMLTSHLDLEDAGDHVFCISTVMRVQADRICTHLVLLPDDLFLRGMLRGMKLA